MGRGVLSWGALGEAANGKRWREENIRKGSMDLHYCQGLLLSVYHSNVRRGSGVDRGGWRGMRSLVRRCGDELFGEHPVCSRALS